jgi:hypothetical protein
MFSKTKVKRKYVYSNKKKTNKEIEIIRKQPPNNGSQ